MANPQDQDAVFYQGIDHPVFSDAQLPESLELALQGLSPVGILRKDRFQFVENPVCKRSVQPSQVMRY